MSKKGEESSGIIDGFSKIGKGVLSLAGLTTGNSSSDKKPTEEACSGQPKKPVENVAVPSETNVVEPGADQEIVEKFYEFMSKKLKNHDGAFFLFCDTLKQMGDIIKDNESSLYQVSLAALKGHGKEMGHVLDDFRNVLAMLESLKQDTEMDLDVENQNAIQMSKTEIDKINQETKALDERLADLIKQIESYRPQQEQKAKEKAAAEERLLAAQQKKECFEMSLVTAYEMIKTEITRQGENITKHCGTPAGGGSK